MTASQANVLIVEDETAVADNYAEWLDAEYAVRTADTVESALAALDESVDVVLLDRRLADLSGEAVLDAVEDRGLDCRVALLSAVEPDSDVFELGYDLHVETPVTDAETLRSAVETLRRRDDYDDKMRRYFALASERGTLEAEYGPAELDGDETYRELLGELDALREDVEAAMGHLDNDDFRADFLNRRGAWVPRDDAGTEAGTGTGTGTEPETASAEASGRKPEAERE